MTMRQFLFIGERRSNTAIRMGVTWTDGRLCASTLFDALSRVGVDPSRQRFMNAFTDSGQVDLATVRTAAEAQEVVVGLGLKAQRVLEEHGIEHVKLVHPAARGKIRLKDNYRRHVVETLGPRTRTLVRAN
ncbi:MAG: hypothetical protein JSS66_05650 [Armatimonadetes bacterium]|nr:hypothetical protein [Armatimonadota bacterium]